MYNVYDTPLGALNMSGNKQGSGNNNETLPKMYIYGGKQLPYVSGQAFRYYLRTTMDNMKYVINQLYNIDEQFSKRVYDTVFIESLLSSGKKTDINLQDIRTFLKYPGLDLFGYMITGEQNYNRQSVLKNSPLLGVYVKYTQDVRSRRKFFGTKKEDKTSYTFTRLYSAVFYNTLEIELDRLGKFIGPELNINSNEVFTIDNIEFYRKVVISDVINGIFTLRGGANQSRLLNDISPVFSVITLTNSVRVPVNVRPKSSKIVHIDDRVMSKINKMFKNDKILLVYDEDYVDTDDRNTRIYSDVIKNYESVEKYDINEIIKWVTENLDL